MHYYLLAGEASGDLHASNLMRELKARDPQAVFRCFGGDLMQAQGGTLVKHYREMAFMGFAAVIANLGKVSANFSLAKKDIAAHKPDALILVDYPSFNLRIAKFVKQNFPDIPVYYYISPKIWAWKEFRIKAIKKYIDRLFSILPFEVDFYKKHHYEISYVGNPSVDAIEQRADKEQSFDSFVGENNLSGKPLVALLAGSRRQEIRACLPVFMQLADRFPDHEFVVAAAPGIEAAFYEEIISRGGISSAHKEARGGKYAVKDDICSVEGGKYSAPTVLYGKTWSLLQQSRAAVVNSGTASLETALLDTPQVVAYGLKGGKLLLWLMRKIVKVKWVSLVNLIANREVLTELLGAEFTIESLLQETKRLLYDDDFRRKQRADYADVRRKLGSVGASAKAAEGIIAAMRQRQSN
jgi:lipid-A-disaccharide synthase